MTDRQMLPWLVCAGAALCWAGLRRLRRRRRLSRQFTYTQRLETVLLPGEKVQAVYSGKKDRWILTSKRLLLETKTGFTAVFLKDIKRCWGTGGNGKKTTVPGKMRSLTLKTTKEITIENNGDGFAEFAGKLAGKIKKQTPKSKAKK